MQTTASQAHNALNSCSKADTSKTTTTTDNNPNGTATTTYYSKSNSGEYSEYYDSGSVSKTVDHKSESVVNKNTTDSYTLSSAIGSKYEDNTYDWTETVVQNGSSVTISDNYADNESGKANYDLPGSGGFYWDAYFYEYDLNYRPGSVISPPPKPNAPSNGNTGNDPDPSWSERIGAGINSAGSWIYDNLSFVGHTALDIAGLVPVIGEPADFINGTWHGWEGDYVNSVLSFAATVPIACWAATSGKYLDDIWAALPLNGLNNVTNQLGQFVGDTYNGAKSLWKDEFGAVDVTIIHEGAEWFISKFTGWGAFGRGVAPKGIGPDDMIPEGISFDITNPKYRQFKNGDNILEYALEGGEITVDWVSGKNASSMLKAILNTEGNAVTRISGYATDKLGGASNAVLQRFGDSMAAELGGVWKATIETVGNRRYLVFTK